MKDINGFPLMAEAFSNQGVPVFLAEVKGDPGGIFGSTRSGRRY